MGDISLRILIAHILRRLLLSDTFRRVLIDTYECDIHRRMHMGDIIPRILMCDSLHGKLILFLGLLSVIIFVGYLVVILFLGYVLFLGYL